MDYNDVPLMRVSHLNKRFGEGCPHCRSHSVKLQGNYCPKCGTVYACRDISFDVYDGEILGVVGESGSGKSTMMQCLYFDQEVTGGSCTIRTYKNGAANIFELTAQQSAISAITYLAWYIKIPISD